VGGEACGVGRVTGQGAPAARWAGELGADGLALSGTVGGVPAVQLAAVSAATTTASRPARFMPLLSSLTVPPEKWLSR
jgi:hypothetical protein